MGDCDHDPKPADFDESVARFALTWGPRAARAYRRRMLASFKISRALTKAAVATQAWRCALAHGNGHVELFATCWAELVKLTGSTELAIGCVNCYRAAHVVTYHPNYRALTLTDVDGLLELSAAA